MKPAATLKPAVILLLAVSSVPALAGLAAALAAGLDSAALDAVLSAPGVTLALLSSVWTGIVATVLALGIAHLATALAASGGWRRRLQALALPLLAMPHLAIGVGLFLVLAPSGLLMRLVSPWATGMTLPPDWFTVRDPAGVSLTLGLVLKETCFLIMALAAATSQLPTDRLQLQARALGYGPLKSWLVVVAPALQERIRLPLTAVLVFGITNVELAIPLGPGLPPTFSVMLWSWFTDSDADIQRQAYAGTLVLLVVTIGVIAALAFAGRLLRSLVTRAATSGRRRTGERTTRRLSAILLGAGWTLGVATIAATLLRAAAGTWRFPTILPDRDAAAWQQILPIAAEVTPVTLALAAATALGGLLLVLPAAEACRESPSARRTIGAWLFLPLLLPQMTFLFGIQVLLIRLNVDGTFVAVVWSHLLFALPYLWGVIAPARAGIDPRFSEVAATLGAGPARRWFTVTAALMTRPALLALALAFSVSVALYLPTLFAGAGRIATAATEAAAAAGSGNLRLASIHAIVLSAAPLIAFSAAYVLGALLFRHRAAVPR